MARYLKNFLVAALLSLVPLALGAPAGARAADEPVASAVIPPPLAQPPAVAPAAPRPKRTPTATAAAKPPGASKATAATANPPGASKATAATANPPKPASPAGAEAWKRIVRSAASLQNETAKHAASQKPSRHAKPERHLQFARASTLPRYPTRPRYYYPGAPVAGPDFDGPPSWYDRGMPPGYPRGPW